MALLKKTYFVTGTDTEVGKTFISCAILAKAAEQKLVTGALKPVAAGCELVDGELRNEDAIALQAHCNLPLPYQTINPVALKEAIAPHIAAQREGKQLQVSRLEGFARGAMMTPADLWLVEGAGGWLVPLNPRETLADLAVALDTPVIVVVAIRLGCINHALLTVAAIRARGLAVAGWVANCPGENDLQHSANPALLENIATLKSLMGVPLLGQVLQCDTPVQAAEYLDLTPLWD